MDIESRDGKNFRGDTVPLKENQSVYQQIGKILGITEEDERIIETLMSLQTDDKNAIEYFESLDRFRRVKLDSHDIRKLFILYPYVLFTGDSDGDMPHFHGGPPPRDLNGELWIRDVLAFFSRDIFFPEETVKRQLVERLAPEREEEPGKDSLIYQIVADYLLSQEVTYPTLVRMIKLLDALSSQKVSIEGLIGDYNDRPLEGPYIKRVSEELRSMANDPELEEIFERAKITRDSMQNLLLIYNPHN